MISLIISYIMILCCYKYYPSNLISFLLMIDSIFTSSLFIIYSYSNTKIQILNKCESLYTVNILDRYIYYIIISLIFYNFNLFLWTNDIILLYIFLLFGCPQCVNKLTQINFFSNIIIFVRKQIEDIVKLFCATQISIIIKDISEQIFNKKYYINKYDIYNALFIDPNLKTSLSECLKNIFIIFLLLFLKKKYIYFYKYIVKLIYILNYGKTNYKVDPYVYVKNIIDQQKWYLLHDPNTIRIIIKLIQDNPDKNIGNVFINEIKYEITKCISIWSLSSCLDLIYIIPPLFLLCFLFQQNKINLKKILLLLILGSIGICIKNYFITIILCIISTFIKIDLYDLSYKNITKFIKLYHFNYKSIYYSSLFLFFILYKSNINSIYNWSILLCINPTELKVLFIILFYIGNLSLYYIPHLIYITYISFLISTPLITQIKNTYNSIKTNHNFVDNYF